MKQFDFHYVMVEINTYFRASLLSLMKRKENAYKQSLSVILAQFIFLILLHLPHAPLVYGATLSTLLCVTGIIV